MDIPPDLNLSTDSLYLLIQRMQKYLSPPMLGGTP
jgi:hypothetical protein